MKNSPEIFIEVMSSEFKWAAKIDCDPSPSQSYFYEIEIGRVGYRKMLGVCKSVPNASLKLH